ncbi:androgen-dependent TFPI-regulating protein-like [Anneissia japonica]|uniref:androgen-dependent TFPI-regulating protein-like n=1 Tax=Anneissia japonica TaxID=1529436 RepID=UPI0014254F92|nr:androgen-dependent TFPI-regulating protein-like [Anneissia japonica]
MARDNSSLVLSTVFHLLAFSVYTYAWYYDALYVRPKIPYQYGGKFKYLTIWCMLFQTVYFAGATITDLVLTSGPTVVGRKCSNIRDCFLASIAFPFAALVQTVFWILYSIDRELIFPASFDAIFPSWLNHIMHSVIIPFLVIEMYIIRHSYPSRKNGILGCLAIGLSYLAWILFLGIVKNIWVYPVFRVISNAGFVAFILVSAVVLLCFYSVGQAIATKFWKNVPEENFKID